MSKTNTNGIVSALSNKVWNLAHVLRDQGLSYGDYLEQITLLLFLKMADERSVFEATGIPKEHDWQSLIERLDKGSELTTHYSSVLEVLSNKTGLLGLIFKDARNRITTPVLLKRVISLINEEQWMILEADVKGDLYEGLLERNAQDVKSGAGQYFTPRPLIDAIVEVMRPKPGQTIADPACGTAGFLLSAYTYLRDNFADDLNEDQDKELRERSIMGIDIVPGVVRLAAMNLYLHGLEMPEGSDPLIECRDALEREPSRLVEMVLTNPPFGRKSSITIVDKDGNLKRETEHIKREGFVTTSNKQLNFLQHVVSMLKPHGSAAVVVPDNVLFEGGAGEDIRQNLLKGCDVHTLLRLPTGIFYAQGVKANVIFFDRKPGRDTAWTEKLWVYDFRTNINFTLKANPMTRASLEDFVQCYKAGRRHERTETERFKVFDYKDLVSRDKTNLDIFWLKDAALEDSANLPAPEELAASIIADLESALEAFREIEGELEA